MSKEQKQVLNYMSDNRIGALPLNGHWVFPQEIRDNISVAETLHERIFFAGGAL